MKKYLVILLMVITAQFASSQNFLSDTKQWNVRNYFWGSITTEIYWIEGIGSSSGLLHAFYMDCVFDIGYDLLCYYNNEELMYIKENENDCFQTSVGIGSIDEKMRIKLMPNPASEFIMLQIDQTFDNLHFQLIDVRGVIVLHGMIHMEQKKIGLSALDPGVYFIKFEQPGVPVLKFLKY